MTPPPITSDTLIQHVLDTVPEFEPVYSNLAAREAEQIRGIDQPRRTLYHLGYFAVHAVAKAERPELIGPFFDNLGDLLRRVMSAVERAACSSDQLVVDAVQDEFLRVMYLMRRRRKAIMRYAGPETRMLFNRTYGSPKRGP